MYIKGNTNAKITFIQYTDLICPYCQKMHNDGTIDTLMQVYPQQINVLFKNFVIHDGAQKAAEALFCIAAVKGKDGYYQAIDKIFASSDLSVD
jgi:protein-disulfide isomerase